MDYLFNIIAKDDVYNGFFRLSAYQIQHRLFTGGMSARIVRECLERGNAVALLPYDPVRDEVILIEQFRIGAVNRKDGPWLLETIAGVIEAGEQTADVARREAHEEAGIAVKHLVSICEYLVSPGCTSEFVTLYCGLVDSTDAGGLYGLAEEHEDIRATVFSREAAFNALTQGRIITSPAVIALQWLELNYQMLRANWSSINH